MKKIIVLFLLMVFSACAQKKETTKDVKNQTPINDMKQATIYQFKVPDINGKTFDFNLLKGKKILIVNTASECGLTPQYEQLQEIYTSYKDKGFTIVGFPANNFGSQEPGSNTEIATFCSKNFGVTFPMMSKISVKGDDIHPIYQFLTQKQKNGLQNSEVTWNFQKYLIDANGHLVSVIQPKTLPNSEEIISWIEK